MRRSASRTPGCPSSKLGALEEPDLLQARPLGDHLHQAATEHCHRQRQRRIVAVCAEERGEAESERNERDVEQGRGERRGNEALVRVERGNAQRGGAHEENVREDPARERDRAFELSRVILVAVGEERRRDRVRTARPSTLTSSRIDSDRPRAARKNRRAASSPSRSRILGQHGQHGVLHGALGQQLAQHVGDQERDEERIRDRARKQGGDRLVASESEDPAEQRAERDDAGAPGDLSLFADSAHGIGLYSDRSPFDEFLEVLAFGSLDTAVRLQRLLDQLERQGARSSSFSVPPLTARSQQRSVRCLTSGGARRRNPGTRVRRARHPPRPPGPRRVPCRS